MPRKKSITPQDSSGSDDLASFERAISEIKRKADEKRRKKREEIIAAYTQQIDMLSTRLEQRTTQKHRDLQKWQESQRAKIQSLLTHREQLQSEVADLVKSFQSELSKYHHV